MINVLPIFGWFLSFVGNVSLAIPFWICWTICGIGEKYGYFLPEIFQSIPFWDCVGIFMSLSIINTFLPKLVNNSSSSKSESNDDQK